LPKLKELRKKSLFTQEQLAKKAKIARETVTRIETGKENPSPTTIKALAKALRVKPRDIEFEVKG
jgi:DNA-binding XRE family transcriptional regulator